MLGLFSSIEDKDSRANIVHFAPNQSTRVTGSVIAAEVHVLILTGEYAYAIAYVV